MDEQVILKTGVDGDFNAKRILSKRQATERFSFQRPCIEVWELPLTYSDELQLVQVKNIKTMPRTAPYPDLNIKPFDRLIAKGRMNIPAKTVDNSDTHRTSTVENYKFDKVDIGITYRDQVAQMETAEINHMDEDALVRCFNLKATEFVNLKLPYENTGFLRFNILSSLLMKTVF